MKTYYAYLARCADNTLYAGYCANIEAREAAHNTGNGAKYTRARRPVQIIYSEEFDNKSAAMRREYQLKRLPRSAKLSLIKNAKNPHCHH